MAILVDDARWPWRGRLWAHLVSDEDLARHVGTIVRVRGGRKGRVELHFRSEEELERLLELLGYEA